MLDFLPNVVLVLSQLVALTTIESSDSAIQYLPSPKSWVASGAYNATGNSAMFLVRNASEGSVIFTFPQPSMIFQLWGYQRSDGGLYSVSIDNASSIPSSQISVYNTSTTSTDPPKLLYYTNNLTNAIHQVTITNLLDPHVNEYGQMNIDRFLIAPGVNGSVIEGGRAPTFPSDGFLAEMPMSGQEYHVNLTLGADAGVADKAVDVLFDTGASGAWVIWAGCTQSVCTSHPNTYTPSSAHFSNSTKRDTLAYGSGGPANTLGMWVVNDTLTFGNATIGSDTSDGATFGAADELPSGGEGLDGNFGMARSYCGGVLCTEYVGFVESMYESGVIKAPVLSLYQLATGDNTAAGVVSVAAIGGVDRNKFLGNMDWIPMVTSSGWTHPGAQRYVQGLGEAIDATDAFNHTYLTFDTGDPGLLGLPHNDWLTLISLVGATLDPTSNDNTSYLFPCASAMTFNFHGTQNRNYTFALADTTTANSGLCKPLANDAGDTTNWITGAPFFNHYYTSWYFGQKGVGSTLGFGTKNVGDSAATSAVVVGVA